ncbi:hypothetical protein AWENTII_002181 [Aspergillus wentii]
MDLTRLLDKKYETVRSDSLDDAAPATAEKRANQVWYGDGSNRWYDKPVRLIVCDNEVSGFVGEHSMMDGLTTRRLNEHIIEALVVNSSASKSNMTTDALRASILPMTMSQEVQSQIDALQSGFNKAIGMDGLRLTMMDCV